MFLFQLKNKISFIKNFNNNLIKIKFWNFFYIF